MEESPETTLLTCEAAVAKCSKHGARRCSRIRSPHLADELLHLLIRQTTAVVRLCLLDTCTPALPLLLDPLTDQLPTFGHLQPSLGHPQVEARGSPAQRRAERLVRRQPGQARNI